MVGLVAAVLLTAGAFGAGALPGTAGHPGGPMPSSWGYWADRPGGYWLGLALWLAGLVLLSAAWWRLGDWPGAASATVPPRWLLVTGAVWAAPLLVAPPLGSRDGYSYACQGALWLDGVDPYRVGAEPGGCVWSAAVAPDWRDTPAPYGPLAIVLSGAAVATARAIGGPDDIRLLTALGLLRVVALAGALLTAGFAPRLARACGVDPAAAIWLALLSPLAVIHLVGGAHNDALTVGLVVTALAITAARPPLAAGAAPRASTVLATGAVLGGGAVLGAAVAVKVTAVLAVPFVVLLAARRTSHRTTWPDLTGAALLAVGAGAAVFAGLTLAAGLDLGWASALDGTDRLVQWTSLPTGLGMAAGYLLRLVGAPEAETTAVTVARAVGTAVLAIGGAGLVGTVTRRAVRGAGSTRGVIVACGLLFAGFALLAPVFYPWYALAALAVLAAGVADRRWRRRLAAVALGLGFLTLPDGLNLAVLTKLPGALFDLALVTALLVALVRRWQPGRRR